MKIVLLPGLDGMGDMFAPFLSVLDGFETQIIALPNTGKQDYETLTSYVMSQLPDEAFILVAESFSGPIAAQISAKSPPHLKGIVFVASFLSSPNRALLFLAKLLPLNLLARLPLSRFVLRFLFLGSVAGDDLMDLFQSTVKKLSPKLMKARLETLQSLDFECFSSELPVVYILPSSDKLVPQFKSEQFKVCYKNVEIKIVEGPHFLLQAKPVEGAYIVTEFVNSL
ncbi:alpha/beta fold hydrolase [Kiloniella antarctica]|uniref:Alpha/beta fold hydrolase n=1 Tax=Kiloniella antarctica TaxID=1550907 RepID=A0ABW5BKK6_9PROT